MLAAGAVPSLQHRPWPTPSSWLPRWAGGSEPWPGVSQFRVSGHRCGPLAELRCRWGDREKKEERQERSQAWGLSIAGLTEGSRGVEVNRERRRKEGKQAMGTGSAGTWRTALWVHPALLPAALTGKNTYTHEKVGPSVGQNLVRLDWAFPPHGGDLLPPWSHSHPTQTPPRPSITEALWPPGSANTD